MQETDDAQTTKRRNMPDSRTKIAELLRSTAPGTDVVVKGWVRTKRGNKNVAFIAVNDGSIIHNIQIVADVARFDDSLLKKITTGSCIKVEGRLVGPLGSGAARRGTGRAHRSCTGPPGPGNLSVAEKRTYARVPARDRLPAPAHEHVRSRTAHPPRHGLRDTQVFQRQGILLSPHSADHGQRRRGRRRHVSGHDARPEQRAEERRRRGRLCAGFLRQTLQPDRVGPARGRARRAGAVADLHVRADVPGRKLEYAPTFGRILDDRARNGVL